MTEPHRRPDVAQPMRKLNPHVVALIVLGLVIAAVLVFIIVRGGNSGQDKLGDEIGSNIAAEDPEARCAATSNNDRIKRELFRRAAATRASDQAAYEKLAGYAVIRSETPILRGYDQRIDSVTCSAFVSIDLPPGVSAGDRRTLSAEVGYVLRGDSLSLTDSEGMVAALATLARDGQAPDAGLGDGEPVVAEPVEVPDMNADAPQSAPEETGPGTAYPGRPSFDCDLAETRGEIAVCSNAGLSALDVDMAAQYRRAVAAAGPQQRAILAQTRDRFLSYRDNCPTVGCMRDAYTGRIREIRDIMEGRWRPR